MGEVGDPMVWGSQCPWEGCCAANLNNPFSMLEALVANTTARAIIRSSLALPLLLSDDARLSSPTLPFFTFVLDDAVVSARSFLPRCLRREKEKKSTLSSPLATRTQLPSSVLGGDSPFFLRLEGERRRKKNATTVNLGGGSIQIFVHQVIYSRHTKYIEESSSISAIAAKGQKRDDIC